MNRFIAFVSVLVVAGCAGRPPQPVLLAQPQDQTSNCAMLSAEIDANNHKIADLAGDKGVKVAQNVAAVAVGLFVWPVLFAADFQGVAGVEIEALQDRQRYLAVLAEDKHCGSGSMAGELP
jgi:hypothetical protein